MNNVWYPYFSLQSSALPLRVKSAKGCKIILEDGHEMVDGVASWWAMCHGYQHPEVLGAMEHQLGELSHVMFGGLTHAPAEELAEELTRFANNDFSKVFFSDSGSTAVEVGLKMAIQYWHAIGQSRRGKILHFKNGYHGETLGAMGVSHSLHGIFPSTLPALMAKIPSSDEEFIEFEALVRQNANVLAGAIIEPVLQGAGGMLLHSPQTLSKIWQILRKNEVLIIADECATGFFRTGTKFAYMQSSEKPDILVLGKALTAGHVGMAATLATGEVFTAICTRGVFFHGPTFMANPLACSAALASLKIFNREDYTAKTAQIEAAFKAELGQKARVKGAVAAVDVEHIKVMQIRAEIAQGKSPVWLRPFGTTLYSMPPLVATKEEALLIAKAINSYAA